MLSPKAEASRQHLRQELPSTEAQAVDLWLDAAFFGFQREWVCNFEPFALWLASRQIGKSHGSAGWCALQALVGETVTIVSKTERDAKEVLQACARHLAVLVEAGSSWARASASGETLTLASGGRILALPASSGGRGFSGSVLLDEFAYHIGSDGKLDEKIWEAAAGSTTLGGLIRICSTPNGMQGLFHEFAVDFAPHGFSAPHRTSIHDAVAAGFPIDVETCRKFRAHGDARLFAQLYECSFLDRAGQIFHGVTYYSALPETLSVSIGVDLAYTSKTSSDFCAAVVIGKDPATKKLYVLDVIRQQAGPAIFKRALQKLHVDWPGTHMFWYASVQELEIARLMREELGFPLLGQKIKADKYTRALPAAGSWNRNEMMVPNSAPWLRTFLQEVQSFTGVDDVHDDQVDALASAFDGLDLGQPVATKSIRTKFDHAGVGQGATKFVWNR